MFMIDRKFRLPRIWSNKILREFAPLFKGKVINISGWEDKDKQGSFYKDYFSNADSYFISNFKGDRGQSNLENEIFLDLEVELERKDFGKYDLCFNHTTLEHVYNFQMAFKNICNLSRDIVIIVVPFAQKWHELDSFQDFWRFSPSAMDRLFQENGLEVLFSDANTDTNSGIYLFYIGSRNPKLWKEKINEKKLTYKKNENLGSWIGEYFFKGFLKKIFT